MRSEPAGKGVVELRSGFHAEGPNLAEEISRVVERELVSGRGVPEDVTLGAP